MPHLLFTEDKHTQLQTILPTVIHHAVLHHTRGSSLRFHHPKHVHLVILQHQQTHTDIVYLHLIHAVFVQFHRVYHAVRQQVGSRETRHGHHLVVHLFQLLHTGITVGYQLPISTGNGRIAQLHTLPLQTLGPYQIGHRTLYPTSLQRCVAVHLCHIEFQAHTTAQRVKQLVMLRHIQRQTVQRRHHGHLQGCRILPHRLALTDAFLTLGFLIRLSACCHQQHADYHDYRRFLHNSTAKLRISERKTKFI